MNAIKEAIRLTKTDNVAVAIQDLTAEKTVQFENIKIKLASDIPKGHKFALSEIHEGNNVIKYGFPIGHAINLISRGEHVHTGNIKTNLSDNLKYSYNPVDSDFKKTLCKTTFNGYLRENGKVGIRNEIWIINTVGCVNSAAATLANKANNRFSDRNFDGVMHFPHPYGCSQLGNDHENTRTILADIVKHPNAGAVLVLGLGCENNNIESFKPLLGSYDSKRIRFLNTQDCEDEIENGIQIISGLADIVTKDKRQPISFSKLRIGFKCGGSDGFSGITANPLVGVFNDAHTGWGGTTILTEVPEMFGAETILFNRCINKAVFNKCVAMINSFKDYFRKYDQTIYENPSPGNKAGGISTLEDKSLGCVQKGGITPVVDVLSYGQRVEKIGLNLLDGPGNDLVSVTAMTASGAHIILFTTGRGTPFGAPVPTVKISTNSSLAKRKKNWIDFNSGSLLEGESFNEAEERLLKYLTKLASGEVKTRNEENNYREIAILKDGVTL